MDEDGNSSARAGVRIKNWPRAETAAGSVILGAFGFFVLFFLSSRKGAVVLWCRGFLENSDSELDFFFW